MQHTEEDLNVTSWNSALQEAIRLINLHAISSNIIERLSSDLIMFGVCRVLGQSCMVVAFSPDAEQTWG